MLVCFPGNLVSWLNKEMKYEFHIDKWMEINHALCESVPYVLYSRSIEVQRVRLWISVYVCIYSISMAAHLKQVTLGSEHYI